MQSVLTLIIFVCNSEQDTGRINLRTGKVFRYRASGPRIFDLSRSEGLYATSERRSAGIPPTFLVRSTGLRSCEQQLDQTRQVLTFCIGSGMLGSETNGSRSCSSPPPFSHIAPARDSKMTAICAAAIDGNFDPPKACRRPQNKYGIAIPRGQPDCVLGLVGAGHHLHLPTTMGPAEVPNTPRWMSSCQGWYCAP